MCVPSFTVLVPPSCVSVVFPCASLYLPSSILIVFLRFQFVPPYVPLYAAPCGCPVGSLLRSPCIRYGYPCSLLYASLLRFILFVFFVCFVFLGELTPMCLVYSLPGLPRTLPCQLHRAFMPFMSSPSRFPPRIPQRSLTFLYDPLCFPPSDPPLPPPHFF